MKKIYLFTAILVSLFFVKEAKAQYPATSPMIYGTSPFQDSLWAIDATTYQIVSRIAPTLSGFTITGCTGLAYDPTTYQTFIIMKVSGVSGRVLGTIDLSTGVCTQIGNLGANFSTIAFRDNGQLYGVTGNGATVPETLYLIDKTTGVTTLATALGNGADGEIIVYNRYDDMFYHWSGNGTVVMEKFTPDAPYTITNIPISGAAGGETFGSLVLNDSTIVISNISSSFLNVTPNGVYGASYFNGPDDLRGLVLPPVFAIGSNNICSQVDTLYMGSGALQDFDSVTYHWGDGTTSVVAANTLGASHVYTSGGNYTVHIELDNGSVSDTIPTTYSVQVNALPSVAISGNSTLCPGETADLSGTGNGTMQWYLNGSPIVGANSSSYTAAVAGVYNMLDTDANGCSDSSHTSFVLIDVPNPVVDLGVDTATCGPYVLDAGNAGATYLWDGGNTAQLENVTVSGTYSVLVTDANNCSNSDTINVVVNTIPTVQLAASDTTVCSIASSITLTGTPAGGTYSGTSVSGNSFDPAVGPGNYTLNYAYTDANGCSNSNDLVVTVNDCTGISEDAENVVVVYPNPFNNVIYLSEINLSVINHLVVTDLNGQVVFESTGLTDNKIELGDLSKGVYVMTIITNSTVVTKEIVKQ